MERPLLEICEKIGQVIISARQKLELPVYGQCVSQGSLKVVISVYPYLQKTPNFSRFYKKLGPFYKKLRCDKFGN